MSQIIPELQERVGVLQKIVEEQRQIIHRCEENISELRAQLGIDRAPRPANCIDGGSLSKIGREFDTMSGNCAPAEGYRRP